MATVTPPRFDLQQDQQKIRNPLARLRKYIHAYVGLEALALTGLFLALVFWVGLIFDYGLFRLFLFDWVQEMPWGFRATLLTLLIVALIALLLVTLLLRLLRQFSDSSMALLLERRFPELLGDRLITAVELADPEAAATHGYSPQLLRVAIHEAAERVDRVPISQVFDWKRLQRRGWMLVVLTVGVYALTAGGFCLARQIRKEGQVLAGVGDFNEVASIWVERNLLLRDVIWPRRAHLEILPWANPLGGSEADEALRAGEISIPQNSAPPTLRVRAWKYVLADREAPEGWRLLTWEHLTTRKDLFGDLKVPPLPEGWKPRDPAVGMTVDEVELLLANSPLAPRQVDEDEDKPMALMWSDLTREKLGGLEVPELPGTWDSRAIPAVVAAGIAQAPGGLDAAARIVLGPRAIQLSVEEVRRKLTEAEQAGQRFPAIRAVIDRLDQFEAIRQTVAAVSDKASDRSRRRVLRQLIVPSTATLSWATLRRDDFGSAGLNPRPGYEFDGNFDPLKETITYTVRGEDYITPRRRIRVVERPRVETLESEEERPAYLFYRLPEDGTLEDVRGKRQPLEPIKLSVSGEETRVEVPVGTNVTLRGQLSKPLRSIALEVEPRDRKTFIGSKPIQLDERGFEMKLLDVRREQRFKIVFQDQDGVVGERKVVVAVREDGNPRIRDFNPDEVIRRGRGNEGFIIAAGCRIPFKGRVQDDQGLNRVRYAVRVIPADFISERKLLTLMGAPAVPLLNPGAGTAWLGLSYLAGLNQEIARAGNNERTPEQFLDLPAFTQSIRREVLPREKILAQLARPQREFAGRLLREFDIKPDPWIDTLGETDTDSENPLRWIKANDPRAPLGNDLPLWRLTWRDQDGKERPIKDPDDTKPQKRFLIEVRLLVEDNYLDGELNPVTKLPVPRFTPSGETFTFVVVPQNELLSRIGEEEEIRFRDLQKAFKPIEENQKRLTELEAALFGSGVDETVINGFVARCDTLSDVLKTSHQDVKSVYATYDRIIREMRVNQVGEDVLVRVFKSIYLPLGVLSDRQFDRTYEAVLALRKALDTPGQDIKQRIAESQPRASQASKELSELISQMNAILAAMARLATLNELIAELARIEKQEEDLESLVQKLLRDRIRRELQGLDD